jgi:Rieske Fe-S protein
MRGLTKITAAVAATMLLSAAPAVAQVSPTEQGYSAPAGTTQQQITSGPAPSAQVTPAPAPVTKKATPVAVKKAAPAKSSKLPFTGLELGLVLAAGAGLLGVGFTLRRLSRPSETA